MIAALLTVVAVSLGGVAARDARPAAAVAPAPPAPVARSARVALTQVGGGGVIHVPAAQSRRFRLDPTDATPRPAVAAPSQVRPAARPPVAGPSGAGGPAVASVAGWRPWLECRAATGPPRRSPPGLPGREPATRPG